MGAEFSELNKLGHSVSQATSGGGASETVSGSGDASGVGTMRPKEVALEAVALEAVRYDAQSGLVPVVVQDMTTGQVLMQAYANREALKRTLGTGQAWFWSRSRQEYWHKGATSGNVMDVQEVRMDCDGDSVLYLVSPHGPACHTGATTCFYRTIVRKEASSAGVSVAGLESGSDSESGSGSRLDSDSSSVSDSGFDSGNSAVLDSSILTELWQVLESRYRDRPQGSYTTYLFEHGVDKVAKKVGEEAVEVALAAKNAVGSATEQVDGGLNQSTSELSTSVLSAGKAELASESADLLYHLLALWKVAGVSPNDVFAVLRDRHK